MQLMVVIFIEVSRNRGFIFSKTVVRTVMV